ncbi:SMP-30/gluconolactonase/LRE family protein [Saccharopolyspora erythraea]|uniref:SMP-30/gluconolactonase/LRE family protein n=1 Tax=Saccharopolyspora erythraea TaxID=1836 RepID=UPI001BA90BB8|nr:SMP-30/gluconolactonase/LRE family protein [Saccharopolyspora erythraea]QUH01177.1 SMP-30/gluconolactonase/LRE family protein [Saccharopolyspora erythraea]
MSENFELLVHRQALCGEGPLWMPTLNCVYWVDILRRELHTYHRESGIDEVRVLPGVVTALAATRSGQLIAAADRGFARLYPGRAALDPVTAVQSGDRMNDGACDPAGRFVAGTLTHANDPQRSALFLLDGGRARPIVDGLTVANGVAWSPDGSRMYLVDTAPRTIWVYDYDVERGRARNGRRWIVCSDSEGRPDGIAVDSEGGVWVAMHWSGRIHRYAPSGDLETVLWAPTRRITSIAFGGPRLDEMYVTSACFGYDERALVADPYAGALFRFRPGTSGLSLAPWNGL